MRKTLWLLSAVAVCVLPAVVQGQWPGAGNPWQGGPGMPGGNGRFGPVVRPAIPGLPPGQGAWPPRADRVNPPGVPFVPPAIRVFPPPEKRRDDSAPWSSIPHVIPHLIPHQEPPVSGGPSAERVKNLHTPREFPHTVAVPASEFRFSAARFSPAVGEEATMLGRCLSGWKGKGILAGIGAALAGLFGRKKES
jgi:hypothetical protein